MRQSQAAVAVIRRGAGDAPYLAQWNAKWARYNFVAGHRHDGTVMGQPAESFRECLVREVREELRLEPEQFAVGDEPLATTEFEAWSQSAGETTRYTMVLFEVLVDPAALDSVAARAENRWLSEAEIASGLAADGRAVSETMRQLLALLP